MIYADTGINWFFPYKVEYEDEHILVLLELPRCHKYDLDRGANMHVDKWITIEGAWAWVGGTRKLVEVKQD